MKYGGKFPGIVPELLEKYRESKSRMQIRQLERYMNTIRCPECGGQRLNAQAPQRRDYERPLAVCRSSFAFATRSVSVCGFGCCRLLSIAATG